MKQNPFIGTWRLVSCETKAPDGKVSYPWGKDAKGIIIYNEDGYISVHLMMANRRNYASGDLRRGTIEEKAAAAETYLSYCGRYEVQGDTVIHHTEICSYPNLVGVDQRRQFKLEGNRLALTTTPTLVDGVVRSATLTWERV